jgi:Sec-independent protein translocase protein TatA
MQGLGVVSWVIVAAIVVLLVGLALVVVGRVRAGRTTRALRRHFGEEYDRVLRQYGGRRRGEAELRQRLRRRRELRIQPLSEQGRSRFDAEWERAQSSFVDTPTAGLRDADLLVMQVMRDRGYPVEQFEERAKLVSVDHPELVQHFRDAHAVAVADEQDGAGTEELRQAMIDYRYLFDELLHGEGTPEVLQG